MTSTTGTAGHPDVEEISDLTEGLLPPNRSTDIRRHLETCEPCADVRAALEEIRGLLGSAPEAEPMPADVAARIDAALAAEGHVSRETSTSADRPADHPTDRPAGRPQATTGPGRKKNGRGRRRRNVVLGTVLTAAVLGAGSLVIQSLTGGSSTTTAHSTPSPSISAFSGASVQHQVHDLLAAKKASQPGYNSQHPRSGITSDRSTPMGTESANTLLQTEIAVPDCVRLAIPRSDQALAAKAGNYGGKSAYLVVLPDPDDSTRVTAYVVDAACIRQQSGTAGTVLLKHSFARR
ncbi:zf-HC2 domain-containing protein [Streptomyces sp. NPDC046942]|uniref:anti-sigma factor family protein n=1 Tax=Streptomyces sp. NPDC046942 TaxID=3155137 RepID=UPI00340425A7